MTLQFIDDYLNEKLNENSQFIRFTFFELRVKSNLSEEETDKFLELCKIKLENMDYMVYFTGCIYTYQGVSKKVADNELMIAIKEN